MSREKPSSPLLKKVKISPHLFKVIQKEYETINAERRARSHFLANRDVQMLALISPGGSVRHLEGVSGGEDFKPTYFLQKCPAIKSLLKSIPGKKFACRFSVIGPGSSLDFHRDNDRSLSYGVVRLHLPIETSKKAKIHLEKETHFLEKGNLYYVDVSSLHKAVNEGEVMRVHLLIDVEVTKELLDYFHLDGELISGLPWEAFSRKSLPLKKGRFAFKGERLPYPLCKKEGEMICLRKKKGKWYFDFSGYSFEIVESDRGFYFLKSLGKGFSFVIDKDSMRVIYCGALVFDSGVFSLETIGYRLRMLS